MVISEDKFGRLVLKSVSRNDVALLLSDPELFYSQLNGVEVIGTDSFRESFDQDIVLPESVKIIEDGAFAFSNVTRVIITGKLEKIGNYAFSGCQQLTSINLPESLTSLGSECFNNCSQLKEVNLYSISEIPEYCFKGCSNLRYVKIGETVKEIGEKAFLDCVALQDIENLDKVGNIGDNAFENCKSITTAYLPASCNSKFVYQNCTHLSKAYIYTDHIANGVFTNCLNLAYVKLLSDTKKIDGMAFNNCINLSNLTVSQKVETIDRLAFYNCPFFYLYKDKDGNNCFSENLPSTVKKPLILKSFFNLNFDFCNEKDVEKFSQLQKYSEIFNAIKVKVPYEVLAKKKNLNDFTFKEFANEVIKPNINEIRKMHPSRMESFMFFASRVGCFDNVFLLDRNGNETTITVAQKASTFMANVMRNFDLFEQCLFGQYGHGAKTVFVNQDLLGFLSIVDSKKFLPNLNLVIELENDYSGILDFVFNNFDKVQYLKNHYLDEVKGVPGSLSWYNAMILAYTHVLYKNVQPQDQDLATEFSKSNISPQNFEDAVKLRNWATKNGIPHHILSIPLKENETEKDKIENLSRQVKRLLRRGKELAVSKHSEFTYEMLDKYDASNPIIGMYTNDCCVINSMFYGSTICQNVITKPDLQHMIVRDKNGDIVAKGTIYVNAEKQYAVINEFSVALKYKHNEFEDRNGFYENDNDKFALARKEIFDCFICGINAFANEYKREHPNSPLKKIVVGDSPGNKLRSYVQMFKAEQYPLFVPDNYVFRDASKNQYILYNDEKGG